MALSSIHVALLGSGGAGIATAGDLLLDAARRSGLRGSLRRSFGPQIRGGETASLLSLGRRLDTVAPEAYDLVVALDWNNAERFASELPLAPETMIAAAEGAGEPPPCFPAPALRLPLEPLLAEHGVRGNLLMVGAVSRWLGLAPDSLAGAVAARLGPPAAAATTAALEQLVTGEPDRELRLAPGDAEPRRLWSLTGNEAAGLGLLRGGIRAAAAYPITPASDLLEWLAPRLERLGGHLVQAEDELASVGMAIGSSFGGVPSMTATAGPGLSLMQEGLSLAVAAEIPLVVVDVQRGGPSTGLPTKSEQSDLLAALFGAHGDAPHVVLAPSSVPDCAATAQWAVGIAEQLQTPVVVLSEQALGQTRVLCDPLPPSPTGLTRQRPPSGGDYQRYAGGASGVAPMSVPGDPDHRYVADGLEHAADGTPTTAAQPHAEQTERRRRKLEAFDFGARWAELQGPAQARCAIVTMGSLSAAAGAAAARLTEQGLVTRVLALRLLAPAQAPRLAAALEGVEQVLVVEQNEGAQLFHYLRGWWQLPASARSLARPAPLPIAAGEIVAAVLDARREAA